MSDRSAEHGTFVVTRTYPATPERAFAAWASRDAKARWFGTAAEANDALQLDFRVGGTETNRGSPPDGPIFTYEAAYQDIVPEERIVYSYTMEADGTVISVSLTTVEFPAANAGTTLTLTEQGVFLDSGDTLAVREKGTGELLDQLGVALA
jgi:uncharacterized protein YndB with AHSA1/START domain